MDTILDAATMQDCRIQQGPIMEEQIGGGNSRLAGARGDYRHQIGVQIRQPAGHTFNGQCVKCCGEEEGGGGGVFLNFNL